jgi:hypothetical protein
MDEIDFPDYGILTIKENLPIELPKDEKKHV